MHIILSHQNKFRGIFSQREIVMNVMKNLIGIENQEDFNNSLLIKTNDGKIDIDGDKFCKFTYQNFCNALRKSSRLILSDIEGKEVVFTVWITEVNKIYYTQSEWQQKNLAEESEQVVKKVEVQEETVSS